MDRVLLGTSPVNFTNEAERWEFNNSLDGWSSWPGDDISLTAGPTYITSNIKGNSADTPSIYTPANINLPPEIFNKIRMKIRKATGPAVSVNWKGRVWWQTGSTWHAIDTIFPEPDWVADGSYGPTGGYSKVVFDMSGVVGWESATIKRMAFSCSQTINDSFDIGEVSIDDGIPTLSPTYRRGRDTGLFISHPGANVMSCSDGELLFDSTSPDFLKVLAKGIAVVPTAYSTYDTPGTLIINTSIMPPPDTGENSTNLVKWRTLSSTSNLHPTAYPSNWNTSGDNSFSTGPLYMNSDFFNIKNQISTGNIPGHTISSLVFANSGILVPTNRVDVPSRIDVPSAGPAYPDSASPSKLMQWNPANPTQVMYILNDGSICLATYDETTKLISDPKRFDDFITPVVNPEIPSNSWNWLAHSAAWHPDGDQIVFVSSYNEFKAGHPQRSSNSLRPSDVAWGAQEGWDTGMFSVDSAWNGTQPIGGYTVEDNIDTPIPDVLNEPPPPESEPREWYASGGLNHSGHRRNAPNRPSRGDRRFWGWETQLAWDLYVVDVPTAGNPNPVPKRLTKWVSPTLSQAQKTLALDGHTNSGLGNPVLITDDGSTLGASPVYRSSTRNFQANIPPSSLAPPSVVAWSASDLTNELLPFAPQFHPAGDQILFMSAKEHRKRGRMSAGHRRKSVWQVWTIPTQGGALVPLPNLSFADGAARRAGDGDVGGDDEKKQTPDYSTRQEQSLGDIYVADYDKATKVMSNITNLTRPKRSGGQTRYSRVASLDPLFPDIPLYHAASFSPDGNKICMGGRSGAAARSILLGNDCITEKDYPIWVDNVVGGELSLSGRRVAGQDQPHTLQSEHQRKDLFSFRFSSPLDQLWNPYGVINPEENKITASATDTGYRPDDEELFIVDYDHATKTINVDSKRNARINTEKNDISTFRYIAGREDGTPWPHTSSVPKWSSDSARIIYAWMDVYEQTVAGHGALRKSGVSIINIPLNTSNHRGYETFETTDLPFSPATTPLNGQSITESDALVVILGGFQETIWGGSFTPPGGIINRNCYTGANWTPSNESVLIGKNDLESWVEPPVWSAYTPDLYGDPTPGTAGNPELAPPHNADVDIWGWEKYNPEHRGPDLFWYQREGGGEIIPCGTRTTWNHRGGMVRDGSPSDCSQRGEDSPHSMWSDGYKFYIRTPVHSNLAGDGDCSQSHESYNGVQQYMVDLTRDLSSAGTVDISFKNGSTQGEQIIAWTLYNVKGF